MLNKRKKSVYFLIPGILLVFAMACSTVTNLISSQNSSDSQNQQEVQPNADEEDLTESENEEQDTTEQDVVQEEESDQTSSGEEADVEEEVQEEQEPTEEPTPEQEAPEIQKEILLEDDFSDETSGWEIGEFDGGSVGYGDGDYIVISTQASSVMWGLASSDFDNTIIEVDAWQVSSPDNYNTDYGIMCRVQENDDCYSLNISGDGWYSIQIAVNGEFTDLVEWTQSPMIKQGNQVVNRIRAVCDGSTIALFVNGEFLAEVEDTTYTSGDIALSATTYETTPVEVHFDNIVVTLP